MAVNEELAQKATEMLGQAMATLGPNEKQQLATIKKQVDDAGAISGAEFDKRLEFCYAILFTPEIANERLRTAAKMYVDAHGG